MKLLRFVACYCWFVIKWAPLLYILPGFTVADGLELEADAARLERLGDTLVRELNK